MFCIKRLAGLSTVLLSLVLISPADAQNADRIKRGEYLLHASGCVGCHTDVKNKGARLAGGRPLKTPFGVYYGPNITPDPAHGIGKWDDADFVRALRKGVSPDDSHYFPVFPYTSFTKMTDQDMRDLKAYIFTLPAVAKPNIPHDINFPYGFRFSMTFWKLMFFDEGPLKPDSKQSKEWNRGAYLVKALLHCGECHTPRNRAGAVISENLDDTADGGTQGQHT